MILLVRHGLTDDNVEPVRIQGRRDVPLNAAGRAQATDLARRLVPESPASLHTSPLRRAHETATVIGAALGLEPRVDERLAESDRGDWEGRTWEEVAREQPEAF